MCLCSVFALLGRQPPEPRAEILAPGALQIIRVRDAHQVGGPPEEVFRLDEMVTLNGFHINQTSLTSGLDSQRCIISRLRWTIS